MAMGTLASRRHRRQATEDDERVQRIIQLVRDGEISRAMRMLHSLGVADVTEDVLSQLQALPLETSRNVWDLMRHSGTRMRRSRTPGKALSLRALLH